MTQVGRAENTGFVHWTANPFILSPCATIPFLLSGPVEFGSFWQLSVFL